MSPSSSRALLFGGGLLTLVVACDALEARREPPIDTSAYDIDPSTELELCGQEPATWFDCIESLRPSAARVTHTQVVACRAEHVRRLDARAEPLPEPDHVVCREGDDCHLTLALGPDVGTSEPAPPAPRHNLRLEITADASLFPWSRGGQPTATLYVRDADSGAVVASDEVEQGQQFVAELLLDSDRRWEVVASFEGVPCHGGVGGQAVVVPAFELDTSTSMQRTLDAAHAVHVTGSLRLADDRPELTRLAASAWAVELRRVDGPALDLDEDQTRVHVGGLGEFELDVFEGTYDVWVERTGEVVDGVSGCGDRREASFGAGRVASRVTLSEGSHLDLELSPALLEVDFVKTGHLPDVGQDLVELDFRPQTGSSGGRNEVGRLDVDAATRVWLWPGRYAVEWMLGLDPDPVWRRSMDMTLERSRCLELEVGAHELSLRGRSLERPGWLRQLEVLVPVGAGLVATLEAGESLLVPPGTYDLALRWQMGAYYAGTLHDFAPRLVVDADTVLGLDHLPLDGRVRLEWVAPATPEVADRDAEDMDVIDAEVDDLDDDGSFMQEPPVSGARLWFEDPLHGTQMSLGVTNVQWTRSTLAGAHLFAGVYDVFTDDADDEDHRWPLAACLPIDGGEPALVPWQPRLRRVTLELDGLDIRKPLEIEVRLLSAAVMPDHRWVTPRMQRFHTFVEPPALYLAPGLYEIAGHQDWGGGQLEPFILEVR